MIVCLAANPSVDKLFEVDRIEVGAIHRPSSFLQVPGGKGLNVARAAHALGAEVVATGILAGHAGRWLEEALAAEGVAARFAWVPGETRASLSVADRETGRLTEFYERGWDIGPGGWEALETVVRAALQGASWLTMSGSLPVGAPADGYGRLIATAQEAGVRMALDMRDGSLAEGIAVGPDLVKVNAEEAGGLLGTEIATAGDACGAARELRARMGERGSAVVTRGPEGAVVATAEGSVMTGRLDVRGRTRWAPATRSWAGSSRPWNAPTDGRRP